MVFSLTMKSNPITIIIIILQAFIAPIASQETVKDTVAQTYNIEEFEIVGKKKHIRNNPAKTSIGHYTAKP